MAMTVVEKTWEIPAHNEKGPVTITDSAGRHIVISPEQADLVASRMGDVGWWIHDCAGD
jgi:hypothetical protein